MLTGAAFPAFSWTFGPSGTGLGFGGSPRSAGTVRHSRLVAFTQTHADPIAPFSVGCVSGLAAPVAASATHSATPVGRVSVNATRRLSGENPIHPIFAPGPRRTFTVLPSATCFRLRPMNDGGRCTAFVLGSMRAPARRRIGRDRSAIAGIIAGSSTAINCLDGLTATVGRGAASRMSTMAFGGSWYFTCARAGPGTPDAKATPAMPARIRVMSLVVMRDPPFEPEP